MEPVGGAVPLYSHLYIERSADAAFHAALARQDSIVLLKGPRQVGKTSLLSRGLHRDRATGSRMIVTDLQKLDSEFLVSATSFYQFLIRMFTDQLELSMQPEGHWDVSRGPNENFERFLRRHVLAEKDEAAVPCLIWAVDEVDRLFTCSFGTDVFALFRSWHNERAFDPGGPWSRLTLAMAYATEAHLFITDLNQSPFNVGTRLSLEDFNRQEVAQLYQRQASPLQSADELRCFVDLVGGHPYLVRRGLHEMVSRGISIARLEATATSEGGPFTDHLQRLLFLLSRDQNLKDAVQGLLRGGSPTRGDFYRLRSAGVIVGDAPESTRLRCPLYRQYLEMHLS